MGDLQPWGASGGGGCALRAAWHPLKCCPEVAAGKADRLEKIQIKETSLPSLALALWGETWGGGRMKA